MTSTKTLLLTIGAAALAAALAAAPDAAAAPRKNRGQRPDKVRMERPAESPDGDATGTVEVSRRGAAALVRVRNLEPRTEYLVVDGTTGETVGTLDTNRRGRGKVALGERGGRRKARADGTEGEDGDPAEYVPDECEIVDPETGEVVLECDLPDGGEDDGTYDYAFGFADFSNDACDWASVSMSSFPEWDSESFYLSFYPSAKGDEETDRCWCTPWFDYVADTAMGDELPLGVDAVADLSGRGFRIVDADGNVVIEGVLPEMEEFDYEFECPKPFPEDPWGELPDDLEDFPWIEIDGTTMGHGDDSAPARGGRRNKSGRRGGVRDIPEIPQEEEPAPEGTYSLWIEGDDGEYVEIGALAEYDPCDFWYGIPEDPGFWEGWEFDWAAEWDFDWSDLEDWGSLDDWNWTDLGTTRRGR
jgi:hypothetical protein